jgi:hypothetical protein
MIVFVAQFGQVSLTAEVTLVESEAFNNLDCARFTWNILGSRALGYAFNCRKATKHVL